MCAACLHNTNYCYCNIHESVGIAVEAKVRTLLNAKIQSDITSDFLLTRSAIQYFLKLV